MKKLLLTCLMAMLCAMTNVLNVSAQEDVTDQYIVNARLSNGTIGWTVNNFNAPQQGNNTTGWASEAYAGYWGLDITSYSLTQTITLPKGNYTLVNYSFFRYGLTYDVDPNTSLAYLKAGSNQVAIKTLGSITASGYANNQEEGANVFDTKMYRNTVSFTIDTDGTEIEIGITGTFDAQYSWVIAGMFELIDNGKKPTQDTPFDVTGYITNPGFEYRDMTGWTLSGDGILWTQANNAFGDKKGGYYAEAWQASGALSDRYMSQTVTGLSNGRYLLSAFGNYGSEGAYIQANDSRTNFVPNVSKEYTAVCDVTDGSLTIKAGIEGGTTNYVCFDRFTLKYYYPYFYEQAIALPNDETALTANQWYYYETTPGLAYTLTGDYANFVYTDNEAQFPENVATTAATQSITANFSRLYFRTTASGKTLQIASSADLLREASSTNPLDATGYIINPSFETGDITGWTITADLEGVGTISVTQDNWSTTDNAYVGQTESGVSGTLSSEVGAKNYAMNGTTEEGSKHGTYVFNFYSWGAKTVTIQQNAHGLPAGIYDLTAVVAEWGPDGDGKTEYPVIFSSNGTSAEYYGTGDSNAIPVKRTIKVGTDGIVSIKAKKVIDWWQTTDDNKRKDQWNFFKLDNVRLTCKGVYVSNYAIELPNDKTTLLTKDQWYYYDVPATGKYALESNKLTDFVYLPNNQILTEMKDFLMVPEDEMTLPQTRVYFRPNTANCTLKITALTSASTSTFTVCSFNVDGLPSNRLIDWLFKNGTGPASDGTKEMSQYMAQKGYDLIGVSEDFNYHTEFMSALTPAGYKCGTHRGGIGVSSITELLRLDIDGLNMIWNTSTIDSNKEWYNESWQTWDNTAETEGNQYIKKGYRKYTIWPNYDEDLAIDVYVLHMDAGSTDDAISTRNKQWAQLATMINEDANVSRPKLVIGDTNSRYTREDIWANFINKMNGKFTVGDPWVELYRDNRYPNSGDAGSSGWGLTDDSDPYDYSAYEVVDKIFYINPTASGSPQLSINSFQINQDLTYHDRNGNLQSAEHRPVVVSFTITKPKVTENTAITSRWSWRGESAKAGSFYLYNLHQGGKWNGMQGFLRTDGKLVRDPNDGVPMWTLTGSSNTTINSGSNYWRMWYKAASGYMASVSASSGDKTTMKIASGITSDEFPAPTYAFKYDFTLGGTKRFNVESQQNFTCTKNDEASAQSSWYLISAAQKAVYDRYVAAWDKAMGYYESLPLEEVELATGKTWYTDLGTLLVKPTYWTEGTTEKLEAINTNIEAWMSKSSDSETGKVDYTAWIVNGSFEISSLTTTVNRYDDKSSSNGDVFGWEVSGDANQAQALRTTSTNGNYINGLHGWHSFVTWGGTPSDGFYCRQTVKSLPEGYYRLSAKFSSQPSGNPVYLQFGAQEKRVTVPNKPDYIQAEGWFYHAGGDIVIGAHSPRWFIADDFRLVRFDYYMPIEFYDMDYATAAITYNVTIPSGYTPYYVTKDYRAEGGGMAVKLEKVVHTSGTGDIIFPKSDNTKGSGLLLKSETPVKAGTKVKARLYRTDDAASSIKAEDGGDNLLYGAYVRLRPVGGNMTKETDGVKKGEKAGDYIYYVLARAKSEGVYKTGFWRLKNDAGVAFNKAYWILDKETYNNYSKASILRFGDGTDEEEDTDFIPLVDEEEADGITDIYTVGGIRTNRLQRGVNIVRMTDGTVKKIMVR